MGFDPASAEDTRPPHPEDGAVLYTELLCLGCRDRYLRQPGFLGWAWIAGRLHYELGEPAVPGLVVEPAGPRLRAFGGRDRDGGPRLRRGAGATHARLPCGSCRLKGPRAPVIALARLERHVAKGYPRIYIGSNGQAVPAGAPGTTYGSGPSVRLQP